MAGYLGRRVIYLHPPLTYKTIQSAIDVALDPQILKSLIRENEADDDGGAIAMDRDLGATLVGANKGRFSDIQGQAEQKGG